MNIFPKASTILILLSIFIYGEWNSIGPEGGAVNSVIQSHLDPDVLFAFTGSWPFRCLKSSDRGASWEVLSGEGGCQDMIIQKDGTLFGGSNYSNCYSFDGGVSWTTKSCDSRILRDIVEHPSNTNKLYATGSTSGGSGFLFDFYYSTDKGNTWNTVAIDERVTKGDGQSVAISKTNPNMIFVGGKGQFKGEDNSRALLYRSTDGGKTFENITPSGVSNSDYWFSGIAINPKNSDMVLASSLNGMYRSTNGGDSWSKVSSNPQFSDIHICESDTNRIIAGSEGMSLPTSTTRIHYSKDGGKNWSLSSEGLVGKNFRWAIIDSENKNVAYTGSTNGFFRSADGGETWVMQNKGQIIGEVMSMAYIETENSVFLNMKEQDLFKLKAGTDKWELIKTPLTCGDYCGIVGDKHGNILALEGAG